MARYDRDDQWNRGDWQRGESQRGEWRADDSRDWNRNAGRNQGQGERGTSQRNWNRDEDSRRGEDMRMGLGYDSETYGRGERSYGESYGDSRRSYRHGSGQGYGGEEHMSPGYGGQGAYGSPGTSTYGSNYGGGSYGSNYGAGSYGSNYGGGSQGQGWERDRSRGFGGSDYRSNWGRGVGGERDYGSYGSYGGHSAYGGHGNERDDWARGRAYGAGDRFNSERASAYGGGMDRSFDSYREGSTSNRMGYSGRGPKGYKRSDDRIKEDVCDRLSLDDEVDASDITVTVRNGEVTLDGSVETRKMKHRAEDIAEEVSGVSDVHNNVRVIKGLLNEVVDRVTGNDKDQHFANSGTRNNPNGTTLGQSGTSSSTSQAR